MEFVTLKKHLNRENPKPCYVCYGDDEFVISRAVSLISDKAGGIKEFNIVDREFSQAEDVINELMQLPVMSDFRVVIARGKLDNGAIEKYLAAPNPSSILVMVSYIPHDSWSHAASPSLPAGAEGVDCNRLPVRYVYPFVRGIAEAAGATVSDAAVDELYARCGRYMTRINSEAQKLALLRAGGEITKADIIAEVRADAEFVVYELGDCILAKNGGRALEIVNGMAKSNDLTAAFTLLYNRFRRMFAAAVDPSGLELLGVKPYMAKKLAAEAAGVPKVKLKAMLDMLADADKAYKSGAMSQYDALAMFVARASSGG